MIDIELSIFKYGTFREKETKTFTSEDDVNTWIADEASYKAEIDKASDECGEDLSKWSAEFSFNGENHRIYLDL